jgi:hypothetical protein
MRRATLLFCAGFTVALVASQAPAVIACCMQPSESAMLFLDSSTIDGEPTEPHELHETHRYRLVALHDGIEIEILDEDGYLVGGEVFGRRVR